MLRGVLAMSKLTELLDELSPDGVEYRPLGEVVKIRNGQDWKSQEPGEIPVYGSGGRMKQTVAIASSEGPSVLLPRKGSLEVQYVNEPIWNVDTVFTTRCDARFLNTRFFYFAMKSIDLGRISTSATRPSLTQSALRKLLIPVPPLEVQQEIVRVLDAFTDLEQSLVSELELRKKQYEFYRDELLSFTANGGDLCSDEVEYRPLGEVIVLHPGVRITRKNDSGTLYPVYGGGGESFRTDNFNRTNDYVISRFAMSENCVRYVPEEFWLLDSGISFEATPTVLKDYVGHNLMQMQPQIFQCSGKSAQRNLRVKDFLTLTLPVPPLEAQQEIVAKLDTFDSLIQSIEQEISLRRKQYEFYRDELLNFVPKED